ncbi:hypothetical protein NEIMUCOT_03789 [Neisseria mucosa ATCC 25996]|uniref:Uncharacterized protein n=1 Tax=Neisseria mucosa (strain ATCC 25996 / DSM 4631 / NCTC 10774 / M26) TaxID=546266 RepID=D2ZT55_NEIM2|nr:hypothetical protein NEIMUCOT_03789 [Neisseria mucosa ATCC 25996]
MLKGRLKAEIAFSDDLFPHFQRVFCLLYFRRSNFRQIKEIKWQTSIKS